MRSFRSSIGALSFLMASTALAMPALAQNNDPLFRNLDGNGVDLARGDIVTSIVEGSIGSGEAELVLQRVINAGLAESATPWDNISLTWTPSQTSVTANHRSDVFPGAEYRGSTLTGTIGNKQYRQPDGTTVAFVNNEPSLGIFVTSSNLCRDDSTSSCFQYPSSITSPDGKVISIAYEWWSQCIAETPPGQYSSPDDPVWCMFTPRIASVSNSYGYSIVFSHATAAGQSQSQPPANFRRRTGALFYNYNVGTTPLASVSYAYPSSGVIETTDQGGRTWRFGFTGTSTTIRRPGSSTDTTTYNFSAASKVTSVVREGVTTTYNRSVAGNVVTMGVTNALSQTTTVVSDNTLGRPTSITDPLSRTTSFQYDTSGRQTRVTQPEGNYTQLAYDTRGNVTTVTRVAKSGSGLANIVTSATYDATCTNPVTCNQPNTTTDALGKVTDYTYDATHGGVLTVTAPAPTTGAVRPEMRYSYTLLNGEYRLTGVSACQTQSSCTGTADEVKATMSYNSAGSLLTSTTANGTGTLTATQTMTYDSIGNLLTVDGPLSGTADTTRYRYSAARETIGVVSPDPDGGGALKHRAARDTYTNGLLTKVERGTVNSQSDTDWSAYAPLIAVDKTYDVNARLTSEKVSSGSTAYALTQTSYDAIGRAECVATRMNPSIYGSLPSSACSLGTQGSAGPDRITKSVFDAAGQVTQRQVAVGTSDQANERTLTYTSNGALQTLKDAENNLTTYVYDGHDRLSQTQLPSPTKGAATSSTTDYEQLTYDAASNVASRRLRDATSIAMTYDNLGRATLKNLPGSEPDVTYAYDNLGRLTSASQTGNALSFTYDALSRNLTQTGPQGTVTSAWDLAGRRTQLTYPGSGLYVNYDYLVTGEVDKIRENGATSGIGVLATFAYNDLGSRTGVTFGNGASQAYAFDPVARLTSLTANLAGTSDDLTIGSMSYNPASQITGQTRSNDAYAWTGHVNVNRPYTVNGLNQYTLSGTIVPTYDTRGNLTSAGTTTYAYTSENMLASATGGASATLAYDPAMRLYQVAGATTTRFAYDGLNLINEYDGSNLLLRRYVFGPGVDEPLVQYEGSGTATRRFLHADERGSVVAVSDATGAVFAKNSYDEYGIPGAGNYGRFQYTGQVWLPELGLQHSKARTYSPTLGRFLQTDPIGYGDGPNWYNYVGGDPVNSTDPSGLWRFNWKAIINKSLSTGAGAATAGAAVGCGIGAGAGGVVGGVGAAPGCAVGAAEGAYWGFVGGAIEGAVQEMIEQFIREENRRQQEEEARRRRRERQND